MPRSPERGTVRLHEGRWYACLPSIRQPDGRRRRRPWYPATPNTRAAAQRLLTRKLAELDANRLALPATDTVAGWVAQFLDRHDVEPSTLSGYRQALRKRIDHPQVGIGHLRLQHLTATRLDEFYLALKGLGYAKSTIAQTHRVLSVALKEAVRKGKLVHSPVGDATLPKFERRAKKQLLIDRSKLWTSDELRAFLEHTRPTRWHPVWHLLATTGLRRSELCGLRWDSVDLDDEVLTVDWKVVAVHHVLHDGDPKTEASIREITLDHDTVQVLRQWRHQQVTEEVAAQVAWRDTGYVFTDQIGCGLHPNRLSRQFHRAVVSSGLRHTTPHALRHLHATLLLDASVPIKEVSARLGHTSTTFTQDRYIKTTKAMDRTAATAIQRLLGP